MVCNFIHSFKYVQSESHKRIDEGIANPEDSFHLFYGERAIWQVKFTAAGKAGHGSLLFENTAAEKIHKGN
jgi:aminoacylase